VVPDRSLDHLDSGAGEHGVEVGGELRVAVAGEEPKALAGIVEIHREVARLLGQPFPGRMGCDTEDVYLAGGVLDHEEDIEPGQGDDIEVDKSQARIPRAWARRN
jgi:hypothetical protein